MARHKEIYLAHLPVFFLTGEVEITKDPIFYKNNFREINEVNLSDFQNRIQSINWRATNELDVNIDYDNFHDKLSQICNYCFSFKEKICIIYQNKYKPWLTPCILNSINKKSRLYKKSLRCKTLNSKLKYISCKNKLTTVIQIQESYIIKINLTTKRGILAGLAVN